MAKLDALLFRERGIHITTLRHPHSFEWLMFDEPKQKPSSLENGRAGASRPTATAGREWRCAGVPENSKHTSSGRKSTGSSEKGTLCIISASPPTKPIGARTPRKTAIPWWNGGLPRLRHCKSAIAGASTGVGCMRFITVHPAGVVPYNESMTFGNCAAATRSCGLVCGIWMIGHDPCLAPVLWGSSKKTGAWNGWRNVLPERRRRAHEAHFTAFGGAALAVYRAVNIKRAAMSAKKARRK